MAQSQPRRRIPGIMGFIALGLLALYAIAGFLILPWWLERTLPEQLAERMGWNASVASVSANPFTLALELEQFSAADPDGEPVAAFEHLRVNLNLLQGLRGIVGFEEVILTEPDIRLDLLQNYDLNYLRDWRNANPPSAAAATPAEDPAGEPLKLYFGQLAVLGGELRLRDYSQGELAEFRVAPLDLTINDLSTWSRDDSDSAYSVTAAVGEQTLVWEGELSLAPLYSRGHFTLSDVQHDTLAHFLGPYLPWQLRDGTVTLESRYELAGGDRFELITSEGRIALSDLAMALQPGDEEPALTTASLTVEGLGFDLTGREATVGMLQVERPSLAVVRNGEGNLDWLANLSQGDDSGADSGPAPDDDAGRFRWSVQGIDIVDGELHWRDEVPETPAQLTLTDLDISLGGLSHRLEEPVSYELSSALASGGQIQANGQFTPQPFTFEAALSGSGLALAVMEPYLQLGTRLSVTGGTLSFDGNLDLDGQKDPMTGTFSGTAEVSNLDVRLPGEDGELISWDTLQLAPIEYNLSPARLEIGTVRLANPRVSVLRNAEGVHNLARITKPQPGPQSESGAGPATARTDEQGTGNEQPGFIFRIGELQLDSAYLGYTDRTLSPPFSTALEELSGSVTGISNVPPQEGRVSVTGQLAGGAPVTLEGSLGALGSDETSTLTLSTEDLSLPALSPYFGRYLGYAVDSGKLALDLRYQITGTRLEASNEVILDRMTLGQAMASDQAVNAPVKLGLALLTDRSGVIDVNLPISGDLSDPQFSVGQIVMRAFVNLLVKAATSPFTMLGSLAELAGFSADELGQVSFVPGSVELARGEADKLSALGKALRERPDLLLNIRGAAAPEADGLSPEALGQLAAERGRALRQLLADTQNVPGNQLFLLDPSRNAQVDEQGRVIVPFSLDVR
ncbi:MAG TPA: DUF748 domain-containing protein [Marinobacter sp.]|nr:DUF748 domain-containing protein [Marinobacter sp.]